MHILSFNNFLPEAHILQHMVQFMSFKNVYNHIANTVQI